MYPIAQIPSPYCYVTGTLCRLFSKPDTTRFSIDWVPLIDVIANSFILNWENILSDNLANTSWSIGIKGVFHLEKYLPFLWVLMLWTQSDFLLVFLPWDGNGLPKTLPQSIFTTEPFGIQTSINIFIKFVMESCFLSPKWYSIRKPLGFLKNLVQLLFCG